MLDGSQAMAKGPGLDCVRVGQPTRFTVTATGVGCDAEVEVLVTAPSGVNLPCSISGSYQNGYVVEYVPVDAGKGGFVTGCLNGYLGIDSVSSLIAFCFIQ